MINLRNKFSIFFIILIFFTINIENVESSSRILGLFTSQSKSHLIIYFAVVRALVEKGHNVTVVTTIPYNEPTLNDTTRFRHIVIESEEQYQNKINEVVKLNTTAFKKLLKTFEALKVLIKISSDVILTNEFQNLMKEEKFDLLLLGYIFNEFHFGLSAHFNCPIIVMWVQKPMYQLDRLISNPLLSLDYSHFKQMPLLSNIKEGTFYYRILNFLVASFEICVEIFYQHVQKSYYENLFPPEKYPNYELMSRNVSLVLVNSHFSEGTIRANVPSFIEIGGIQIKSKPDPLPDDIKTFLDNSSEYGAIFFSLGSNVQFDNVNKNITNSIYAVFSKLKQNIIWKWDNDSSRPGNSKNILFKKWLPQDDILSHSNIKLFITHGGKGSVVESTYHGVPMIGLPVFGDQTSNIVEMVDNGFGLSLNMDKLTEEKLENTINEILLNDKYRKAVKKFSTIYRDRPITAKETAIYWIEYVLRHNGARHMQSSGVFMTKIELLGLDVIALFLIIIYITYELIKYICKFIWRIFKFVCKFICKTIWRIFKFLWRKCFGRWCSNNDTKKLKPE